MAEAKLREPDTTDGNDTDNEVFRSGSESPQFTLPVGVDPKHRRATVSGGSPTLGRPSLLIQDLDPPTRPKSQFVNSSEKEAAIASLGADNRLGVATIWDDKSKEMSELTANERIEKFVQKISQSMNVDSPTNTESPPSVSEDSPETVESPDQKPVEVRRQEFRVTKPTPVVLENPYRAPTQSVVIENPYRTSTQPYSMQKGIVREVATDTSLQNEPTLMTIKRIDSLPRGDIDHSTTTVDGDGLKEEKHVIFSDDTKDEKEEGVSYTHIVVGGVVQKIPVEKVPSLQSESPTVRRRNKPTAKRVDRRVSCKDLGKGDCEGWLYKRKTTHRGPLTKNWAKRWCILKNCNLFYYKEKDSLKAEGVIHLPAFQVSPAPDVRTKKFAFKVHNAGTTFCFASERQDDMSKWMNKMGLAAINFDTNRIVTTGGFIKPEPRSPHPMGVQNIYYSESEDDGDDGSDANSLSAIPDSVSSTSSDMLFPGATKELTASTSTLVKEDSPTSDGVAEMRATGGASRLDPGAGNPDDLTGILRSIHHQHLTIDGIDRERLRRSQLTSLDVLSASSKGEIALLRKLQSLQRTLKAKEQEVEDIDTCLKEPSHDNLQCYQDEQSDGVENFV